MNSTAASLLVALMVTALLTPLVRAWALQRGVVDRPGGRRVNRRVVPRLGGVAVVVGFFAPLACLFVLQTDVARSFYADPQRVVGLLVGGVLVAWIGALDDLRGVSPLGKLGVQSVAASVAFACGFRIEGVSIPWLGPLEMGIFALPVTIFWFLAIVNAVNLIDGLDGLAAGISLFATVTNFVIGYLHGDFLVCLLCACLAGALIGFLCYNFNPATIFLGDSGSMFLGYVLAAISLMGASLKSSTTVSILVPIVALGVPIIDTLLAMLRRTLARQSMFQADRAHIHHRLLDLGLTHRRAVLILYAMSIVFTGAAISIALGRDWTIGLALLVVCLATGTMVRTARIFDSIRLVGRKSETRVALVSRLRETVRKISIGVASAHTFSTVKKQLHLLVEEGVAESCDLLALEMRNTGPGLDPDSSSDSSPSASDVASGTGLLDSDAYDFSVNAPDASYIIRVRFHPDLLPVTIEMEVLMSLLGDACSDTLSRLHTPVQVPGDGANPGGTPGIA